MVELGQQLFGNKWEEHKAPDFVSRGLYDLSEQLGRKDPQNQAHGLLGGEYGYGQDFENEVFEMHPYWWGECECGYEQRQYEWEDANKHEDSCYQTELALALAHEDLESKYGEKTEQIYQQLTKKYGLPMQGCAVHCTCSWQKRWEGFLANDSHEERCRVVLPNFRHKASGLAVFWYKYIGRSMTANQEIKQDQWEQIVLQCRASIK